MNLQQFLLILRARYKGVLLMLLGTVAVTLVLSVLLPKQYTATASVVVDVKSPDPLAGVIIQAMIVPGYMATQVDIINSDRVAHKVVKLLKLDENHAVKEQWMEVTEGKGTLNTGAPTIIGRVSQKVAKLLKLYDMPAITEKGMGANQIDSELEVWLIERLQKKLTVKPSPSRESNVINIAYTAMDPGFAAAIANAFAQAYIDTNIELNVEPAKQYATWFGQQGKSLRNNVEKAQAKLSEYQQKHGIVASDERLDNETAKLNELSTQLTVVQGQTSDAQSKQKSGNATLPEVVQNPLIQGLKADIAQKEAYLQDLAGNLGKNHPQYQRAESEIASLKQKLEVETRHITSGFSTSKNVGKEKEINLKAAIEAQKRKILDLKNERDQLSVLQRDVDSAQNAYDAVIQRFNQSNLESHSTQTNVTVLTPATEPIKPSFPKLWLNIFIAVFLGTLLGIGAAMMFEMFDRRIRSVEDLAEMLQLPVLSIIQRRKKQGRLTFWRSRTALVER